MNVTKHEIGARVKEIRAERTQKEFSEMLGVTRQSIADVESGRSFPGIPILHALAIECGICLNWLITGTQCNRKEVTDSTFVAESEGGDHFARLLTYLWDLYTDADQDMRGWLKVQLMRAIPELEDTLSEE